jgi:hypothetical protein
MDGCPLCRISASVCVSARVLFSPSLFAFSWLCVTLMYMLSSFFFFVCVCLSRSLSRIAQHSRVCVGEPSSFFALPVFTAVFDVQWVRRTLDGCVMI